MINDLPTPIAAYVEANARLDPKGMLAPFARNAVVLDYGGRREGHGKIEAWMNRAGFAGGPNP